MSEDGKITAEQGLDVAAEPGKEKKFINLAGVPPAAERPKITIDQMNDIIGTFSERIFKNPTVAPKLQASGLVLRMEYYDPENWGDVEPEVTIDCTQTPIKCQIGSCNIVTKVTLRMHSHIAHMFWMQKISMMVAVARRQMVAKGPIAQVMRVLPIIKPSYPIYKEVLRDLGLFELLAFPGDKVVDDATGSDEVVPSEGASDPHGAKGL
jgi:hypothetical protein